MMNPRTALLTRPRRNRGRSSGPLLAALGLLAWLAPPLEAEVIDDFSGPPKWTVISGPSGMVNYEVVDGQLKVSHEHSYRALLELPYVRNKYPVPEERALELRMDLVSASDHQVWTGIAFIGQDSRSPNGWKSYILYCTHTEVVLVKNWGGGGVGTEAHLVWHSLPAAASDPVTMRLTLKREAPSLRLGVQVVKRDDPSFIVYQTETLDTPSADVDNDSQPPFLDGSWWFDIIMFDNGDTGGVAEWVIDNLVCSENPVPSVLKLQRQGDAKASLEWQGMAVPFEADSLQGPWKPCAEGITLVGNLYRQPAALTGTAQFFRLLNGWHDRMLFEPAEPRAEWRAAGVKDGTLSLGYNVSGGRLRLSGSGDASLDFVFRDGSQDASRLVDCVASVDLMAWGAALEGARIGLLLRVRPPKENWYLEDGLPDPHYAGLLTFKRAGSPSESELALLGWEGLPIEVKRFPAVDPAKQYRLQFSAVGQQLTLQLFDLTNLEVPVQTCVGADDAVSEGMAGMFGTISAGGAFDVTIDRFIVNGSTR